MKNDKLVIFLMAMSLCITSVCFYATYKITENTKKYAAYANYTVTNNALKEELKKRLENSQRVISTTIEGRQGAFSEQGFKNHMVNFEQKLNQLFDETRQDLYEIDSKMVKSSSLMVDNTKNDFNVSMLLQNVTKEMLKVKIEKGYLVITAEDEKVVKSKDKDGKEVESQQSFIAMNKVIKLPKNVVAEKATISFKENVLVIKIPKTELKEEKPVILELK